MNIKDDEYINNFDIKNVKDIDQVIDFMKGNLGFFRGIIHEIDIDCAFTFA
jgi:hypothetical protein